MQQNMERELGWNDEIENEGSEWQPVPEGDYDFEVLSFERGRYNGGAKLTTEGSVSVEDLKNMEAQGVEILTCGTCLNFYGLTDKLAVGGVTNMYTIVEKLASAGKVIKP